MYEDEALTPLEKIYRIRTGEEDESAVTPVSN